MNPTTTLLGEIIFISVIVIVIVTSVLSYYLGKRKTSTPKIATFIGVLLAFIPPLGLIYIAILVLKNDINQNNTGEAVE